MLKKKFRPRINYFEENNYRRKGLTRDESYYNSQNYVRRISATIHNIWDREFKFQKDIQPGWRTLVVIIDIAPLVVERHLHSVWIRLSMVSERERNNETERARLSTLAMLLMHKIIAILLHEKIYDIEFLRLRHPPLSLFSFPPSRTSNTRRCSCAQGCVRLPLSRTRV